MNNAFTAAMGRALAQTRAGNSAEATRIIQAALAGDHIPPDVAPPARPPAGHDSRLSATIEEAEVVEVTPAPGVSRGSGHRAGLKTSPLGQVDLHQFLDRMGCMGPQGSILPQGLSGLGRRGAAPHVPDGARYETRRFTSALGTRDYRLFVPATAAEGVNGLVVMLHGCTQDPDDFACGTDMNRHAQQAGLIVVYPHQTRAQNPQGCWNWFRPEDQRAETGEAALLAQLAQAVALEFAVPQQAVFAAGLSAGGAMAATLAATQPEVFAAVGVHSGLPHGVAHDIPSAFGAMRGQGGHAPSPARGGVRMIVFHGTADATVHPSNAERLVAAAKPTLQGATRRESGRVGGRAFHLDVVEREDGLPLIESWRVEGTGHAWSGGNSAGSYADPAGPDASAEMVRFFMKRSR